MRTTGPAVMLTLAFAAPTKAQTLLETVLYVVSLHETVAEPHYEDKVTQNGDSIYGESHTLNPGTIFPDMLTRATWVRRMTDCKFEVSDKVVPPSSKDSEFTVDFSRSDFQRTYTMKNSSGFLPLRVAAIPDTQYCLARGTPYLNNIGAGSCADVFYAEVGYPDGDTKMLAAIHRLQRYCEPRVSQRLTEPAIQGNTLPDRDTRRQSNDKR